MMIEGFLQDLMEPFEVPLGGGSIEILASAGFELLTDFYGEPLADSDGERMQSTLIS